MPAKKETRKSAAKKTTRKTKNAPAHHVPNFLDGEFEFPKLEEKVLAFWDEHKIFEKSLEKNLSKRTSAAAKKKFIFYEGPPYANGKPGIHHVLARVVKDVILRYKTMRGYYVPRRAGWDTHGLPVEMAAEKALGFKSKKEIEQYGIEAFNKKAKEQVWLYKDEWENITRRIGYWLDLKNAYVTYEPEYIESVWWTIAQIAKRKLLYKGHKVVPWCTRCGTALSSHELAQGYKEVEDNAAYVKFKLKSGQKIGPFMADDKTYILSWTTTPWTLPGNVALAVGKDIEYVVAEKIDSREKYILAKDIFIKRTRDDQDSRITDQRSGWDKNANEFLGIFNFQEIKGSDLVRLEYEPLFKVPSLKNEKSYKIYPADFVTTTDGTGVVHIAPMYGEDDYALGKKFGFPERHTVSEEGKFTKDVAELEGRYAKAKETEEKIFDHLKARGNFLSIEKYAHEYPYCWRCGTAILYYARISWFIGMSGLRKELLARNKNINWMPAHVKEGRFGEWLREAKDWNLSRERYWGTPLPIWECKKCGHASVAGSMDELSRLAGGPKNNYWVMRHGEAENNAFDIINSKGGAFHLTPRGKRQVTAAIKKLKTSLAREHKHIDIIIASDVLRTKETGNIAAEIFTGEKILIDARLEEIHLGPAFDGYRDEKYHKQFSTYESRFEKRPEGGESLRDVRRRVWEFLRDCEKKYKEKNILIVSHEYPIWMLSHAAEGWSEKRAITEKEKIDEEGKGGVFIDFAEIRKLDVKILPRNESGEVDLHRPYADEMTVPCVKCGADMRRVPEVADVWYDSGAMPFAQAHFPFASVRIKNGKSKTEHRAGLDFPADYIAEGMDQTRGWFYTMLAIATAMDYPAPYRNVVSLGLINDKFGQKMSKSKGNIVNPWDMMEKYGIDAVRWYFFTAAPLGEPKDFDEQEIMKSFRKTHLIVYHSFIFWKTYARRTAGQSKAVKSKNLLDRWILARLHETINGVAQKLERYEIREAALETGILIDDLSRWYIRRSRRRLQKPETAADYQAASATLHYVLLGLAKLMAPFTPFFAEMLYAGLGGEKESVHLDEYPASGDKRQEISGRKLTASMQAVRETAALGLSARAMAGIKVRQPLARLKVKSDILMSSSRRRGSTLQKSGKLKIGKEFLDILADEVNVKEIVFDAKIKDDVELDTAITPALREEGMMREFIRKVQELRQKAALQPKDIIAVAFDVPPPVRDAITKNEAFVKTEIAAKMINIGRSDKMNAEETIKMEGAESWIGIRKI